MGKHQSEEVKVSLNWELRGYEEYIAGYKLYKQLKKKWDAIEKEVTADVNQQIPS